MNAPRQGRVPGEKEAARPVEGRRRYTQWLSVLAGPAAMVATAALLLGAALLLNLSLTRLTQSRQLAFEAATILRQAAEIRADVRTAETGQRGYLLTGDLRYLEPYNVAIGRLWAVFGQLQATVRDPQQLQRLVDLKPLIQAKLDELARTVELRRQSFDAALAVVQTDLGQRLMEVIDARVQELEAAEQAILDARTGVLENDANWATRLASVTGLLALLSAVAGALWLANQRSHARLLGAERRFRMELEGQVAERTKQLTDANEELDAFAYTISHDLRAPLRAMHGYAEALAEDFGPELPEDGKRFTKRIQAAATRMESLIQDILSYSRLAREDVILRPVALERAVDAVLSRAAERIGEVGAVIAVERPLPDVLAHAPTLGQVVENLLLNAIKFVTPGDRPQVRVSAEHHDGRVRLLVDDNGIGIAAEHHDRIFRPFERLHGAETYPGTGIGLAIVRRGIERMGGRVGVEALPDQGSRFWFELDAAGGVEHARG
ncbi:MAG TPA: CHASE3 domain-containing protein [Microvirga sp.]|nr:CHASE3 domain-containing protein [Microvirga sp.]